MKCVECRKEVAPGEAAHTWSAPGLRAGRAFRYTVHTRHAACQEKVEREVAQCRARDEEERQAMLNELAAKLGAGV